LDRLEDVLVVAQIRVLPQLEGTRLQIAMDQVVPQFGAASHVVVEVVLEGVDLHVLDVLPVQQDRGIAE
jgi:hypothetical protein